MKTILRKLLVPAVITAWFPTGADAAITVSGFTMTKNSVTFQISGQFPSLVPLNATNVLYFANPEMFATPGFALGSDFVDASSSGFTGSQPLRSTYPPVGLGRPSYGDYFYVAFVNSFAAGEAIDGTLTASWATDAIDPSAITSLNVYWGATGFTGLPNSGTLLTSVAVPESSTAVMITGALGLALVRRRRHH